MNVPGVVVLVVLVAVTLVDVVYVARLIAVVFVSIALVDVVVMHFRMMFVAVTLVDVVDMARLIAVVFVGIALVNVVLLHYHRLRLLASRPSLSASVPFADTYFEYQYNPYFDTIQEEIVREGSVAFQVVRLIIRHSDESRSPGNATVFQLSLK